MQMFVVFLLIWCVLADECKKPIELKEKEEYCWTEEVEVVDRIVQTSKSVLNFAKKKLGMAIEGETTKQKCEYYLCILRQLQMLDANDYPACKSIKEWSKKYVVYNQALGFIDRLEKCYDALNNSTLLETTFYADQVDEQTTLVDATDNTTEISEGKEQNVCDIAAEFVKCLSRQKECPVFQYP